MRRNAVDVCGGGGGVAAAEPPLLYIYRSHQFAEKKVYTERLCTVYGDNVNKGRTDSCGAVQCRNIYTRCVCLWLCIYYII